MEYKIIVSFSLILLAILLGIGFNRISILNWNKPPGYCDCDDQCEDGYCVNNKCIKKVKS